MLYLILALVLLGLILGPNLWVRHVLARHQTPLDDLPGTGAELARHLLTRFALETVKVEQTVADNDHYSPQEQAVRLSPAVFSGRSLTAVAIAAHEVGHAIQYGRDEPICRLRARYQRSAGVIQQCGIYILMALPLVGALLRIPHLTALTAVVGFFTLFSSVLLYTAVLPQEWDASFNKALPILEQGGYVDAEQLPAVRSILKACALTYVAAALADVLRLWRWLRLLR